MAPCGVTVSHAKYQQTDLSIPWLIQPYRMAVPWPREESHLIAATRPFQSLVSYCPIFIKNEKNCWLVFKKLYQVWIYLGVSVTALSFVLTLLSIFYEKYIYTPTSNKKINNSPSAEESPQQQIPISVIHRRCSLEQKKYVTTASTQLTLKNTISFETSEIISNTFINYHKINYESAIQAEISNKTTLPLNILTSESIEKSPIKKDSRQIFQRSIEKDENYSIPISTNIVRLAVLNNHNPDSIPNLIEEETSHSAKEEENTIVIVSSSPQSEIIKEQSNNQHESDDCSVEVNNSASTITHHRSYCILNFACLLIKNAMFVISHLTYRSTVQTVFFSN